MTTTREQWLALYDALIEMRRDWVVDAWANCADIMIKKGKDYGKTDDSLSNLRDFGAFGVVVRLSDKWHRLKNAFIEGKNEMAVEGESIGDTIDDSINYYTILRYLWNEERAR